MSHIRLRGSLAFRLLALCLLLCFPSASFADEPTLTPTQVVHQGLAWYPQDLPKAATLTTTKIPDGLSPKHWVAKKASLLKDLQLKYLEWKILEEERDEVTASVTVQVRLFVMIGEVRQVETYSLKKMEGHWLIDDQQIQGGQVIGRTI